MSKKGARDWQRFRISPKNRLPSVTNVRDGRMVGVHPLVMIPVKILVTRHCTANVLMVTDHAFALSSRTTNV